MTGTAIDLNHSSSGTALAIQPGQIDWDTTQLAALDQLGLKDAGDGDRAVFLHVCQRTGLDPFARQIYMIARKEQVDGQWRKKWTIQTGIDGFRVNRDRAERKAGMRGKLGRARFYDPDGNGHKVWVQPRPPVACEITYTVRDRDGNKTPYTSVLRFTEYCQTNNDGHLIAQWKTKPAHMLEKCQHGASWIATDRGPMRIRDIVNGRLPVKVRSIDLTTGEESWQPVVNWWRNGLTSTWARLWAPNGSRGNKPIRVTPNHHMWTPQGWREAGDLLPGDLIAVASPVPSGQQDQVILGSLLGDGSLSGRKRESSLPHLDEAHSVKQRGYILWKAAALDSLGIATAETEQGDGTGKRHPVIRMRTAAIASLLKYRSMKPEDMLSQLGPLGLAVWFMDDGSISLNRDGSVASAILHCCGFSEDFAQAAVAWLADLGVDAVVRHGGGYPRVAANSKDADALLELIQSWVIRDGSHKIWCGGHVKQGHNGYAFVPVLRNELSVRPHREQRYDIEVANTHTMIANGFVTSNCTEADVYRKAFPQDFSGIYLDDAMPPGTPQDDAPANSERPRGRVTTAEVISRGEQAPAAGDDTRPGPQRAVADDEARAAAGEVRKQTDPRAAGAASPRGAQPPPPQDHSQPEAPAEDQPGTATEIQLQVLHITLGRLGFTAKERDQQLNIAETIIGRQLTGPNSERTSKNLSMTEARKLTDTLDGFGGNRDTLIAWMAEHGQAGDSDA